MLELNKFYNMDCLEGMKQIPDKYFDLAIVDPPYGIGLIKTKAGNWGIRKEAKGDIDSDWDFQKPSKEYFQELFRVSKNQIIWGANHFIENMPVNSSCWIVWDKRNGRSYFADCELAFTSFKTAVRKIELATDRKNRIHNCQKPIKLYEWLLDKYAKPGYKILDTHVGSGSSIIACQKKGFEFIGFELNSEYHQAATERINNYKKTRQQADLFNQAA